MDERLTARQWLNGGGGGFEGGEDGIRACTMSAKSAIELMDEYAAYALAFREAEMAEMRKEKEEWHQAAVTIVKKAQLQ